MQKKLFVLLFSFIAVCSIVSLVFSAYMGTIHMRTFHSYADTGFDPRLTERELFRAVILICASVLCFLSAVAGISGSIFLLFPSISAKLANMKKSHEITAEARKASRKASRKAARIAELEEELEKLKKDEE